MSVEFETRLKNIEKELNLVLEKPILENNSESVSEAWMADSFFDLPQGVSAKHALGLLNPCRELMLRGGKRWRPLLCVLSCEALNAKAEEAYKVCPLIELCHTASLIHDDIEDKSDERRGGPSIHLKYGIDVAINAASWLYFQAMTVIQNFAKNKDNAQELSALLYKVYSVNLRRLHLGQAMDIAWHKEADYIPSKDEYLAMINLKTGSLARLAGELGAIAAGKQEADARVYGDLMAYMGLSFQILDDVKNISQGIKGKKYGDDIVEGKKSLPVILYLQENPEKKELLLKLFRQAEEEGIDSPAVEECINLISSSNALVQAKKIADEIMEETFAKIKNMYPDNNARVLIFELFNMIL